VTSESARTATVGDTGEHALIARIRSRLPAAPSWVLVGVGDDAAVIRPERNRLDVVTTDIAIEHVHFDRRFVPADAIGHRAVAANLSDLAAMGAAPRYLTLSLGLPADLPLADFDAIVDGALALASRHKAVLVGGNISRSPGPLIVDISAVGTVKPRKLLTRAGARPGDVVVVSGTVGAARAGLQQCQTGLQAGALQAESLIGRFSHPEPRIRLGLALARLRAAGACMDLSDGLADALAQLAVAGGVGMEIDADALPIDRDARQWFERSGADPITEALAGGDDYELVFTMSPRHQGRLRAVTRVAHGLTLTRIGVVTSEPGVTLRRDGRRDALPAGFEHFAN
jgi:thiamine-monophosphate kinase